MDNEQREHVRAGELQPKSKTDSEAEACFNPSKMMLLFNAAKALTATTDLDNLLNIIVSEVQSVLNCEGAGVLLHDVEKDDFYWRSVQDKENFLGSAREEIRIPKDQGVCGWVFRTGEPALVHDALNDPRVYRSVDEISGFITRNMVCVPLQLGEKRLGVLYAMNKYGDFSEEDMDIMTALSSNIALALENASHYENLAKSYKELERLNRVKNKILHHLSHELKTPLSIIEASLRIMQHRIDAAGVPTEKLPFERIIRNLGRLKTIERQVAHIVEDKEYPERSVVVGFLDTLPDLLEIQQEDEPWFNDALESLKRRIEAQFPSKVHESERVSITEAFRAVESRVNRMLQDRILDLEFLPPNPATIKMQPQHVVSILRSLVRNAVENTPDHGKIIVRGEMLPSSYRVTIQDFGVGIPESEQPNIFEGFYPVQETDMYSSGRRYEFNAGGTGTDLLKIKIFAERFGFKVAFRSRRCPHIPTPRDLCPGDIDKCPHCETIEDCKESGGTEFSIEFPAQMLESES